MYMVYLGSESENGEDINRGVLSNKSLLRALELSPTSEHQETVWNMSQNCPS